MSKHDDAIEQLRNHAVRIGVTVEEYFKYRISVAAWREMLLRDLDTIAKAGRIRQLVGKSLGAGVIEVRLAPLDKP